MKIGKDTYGEVVWHSPANIALIKYWGKRENQIPENPSLSFTLKNALAQTNVSYSFSEEGFMLDFTFEGKENSSFSNRIEKYLRGLIPVYPWLNQLALRIESKNTFPHSAGIASSAAGMSSLALCLNTINYNLAGKDLRSDNFLKEVSDLSRQASGSAARSVYGGFVSWGKTDHLQGSSNYHASALPFEVHKNFTNLCDTILITYAGKKSLSSSEGHDLMKGHPFSNARFVQANEHILNIVQALKDGDWERFISITELEAMTLHALIMSSVPAHTLLKPATLTIIEKIRLFREQHQLPVCFTLDAGPNVHMIYPEEIKEKILALIEKELLEHCQDRQYIDDGIGKGPEIIKNEFE